MKPEMTLSIEGMATAIGVLGAAIGYVVNLIKRWQQDRKDKSRRGTYSVILHLLEADLLRGLTEDQLWGRYNSTEAADIIERYKALSPSKLDPVRFEALIRDLRLDRLIELVGRDTYRLETRYLDKYDLHSESLDIAADAVNKLIPRDAIAERVRAMLLDTKLENWERKKTLELLIRLSPEEAVKLASTMLTSTDKEDALIASEVLTELQSRKSPFKKITTNELR